MNYEQIRTLALSYSDREDEEVISRIDDFILMAEARFNRAFEVGDMATRAVLTLVEGLDYYPLPPDFAGLRGITIDGCNTPEYLTIEQVNEAALTGADTLSYTIIGNQLWINPGQSAPVEIVYYQKIRNLSEADPTNWISNDFPDAYIFGILVEINSFVKDGESMQHWDTRFKETVQQMDYSDKIRRWSGTSLQTRTG